MTTNDMITELTQTVSKLQKDIQKLKKHIKYIEMVLKEKKDELFCLLVEKKQKNQDNKKGA